MRRMRAIAGTGVWLVAVAICSVALAEDPTGGIIPERKDLYSVYSDAYHNPDSVAGGFGGCPNGAAGGEQLFYPLRTHKYYVGGDLTPINRNHPKRRVFIREPGSGEDGRKPISRFDSDEFIFGNQNRYRGWVGIEFPSENRLEFSYFQTENFAAATLTKDVFGTSLFQSGFVENISFVGSAGYDFDFQGAELLYRWDFMDYWRQSFRVDLLLGLRYFGMNESAFFVDSLDTTVIKAAMSTRLSQHLFGPEIGLNARREFFKCFEFDLTGKIGVMCNSARNRLTLISTDPSLGNFDSDNDVNASSRFMEGRFVINFYPHKCVKLFAGWEFVWMFSVGTALGEFPHEEPFEIRDFRPNQKDNILYDGFLVGGEVTF